MSDKNTGESIGRDTVVFLLSLAPYFIIAIIILLTAGAIVSMLLVDVVLGQVISDYWVKDPIVALGGSLATTGLVTAVFTGAAKARELKAPPFVVGIVGLIAIALILTDAWFDGLGIDVLKFGAIVDVNAMLTVAEVRPYKAFRLMWSAISLLGEPLTAVAVLFFPWLKEFFLKLVNQSQSRDERPSYKPAFRPAPVHAGIPRNAPPPAGSKRPPYSEPTYHPIGPPTKPAPDTE